MDVIKRNMTSGRISTVSRLLVAMTGMALFLNTPVLTLSLLTPSCVPICNCTKSPFDPPAPSQYSETIGTCICQDNGLIPDEFLDVIGLKVQYFDHVVLDNESFTNSSFSGLYQLILSGVQYIKQGGFRAVAGIRQLVFRDTFLNIFDHNIFTGLSKLGAISADYNNIHALKDGCFEGLGNLRNLSLVKNSIWSVSRNNFLGLEGLQRLDLSKNKLVRLMPQTFVLMPELQILTIKENAIVRIEQGAFSNLTELRFLYLEGNQIKVLSEPLMFRGDNSGYRDFTVRLHDNPLECDCRNNWIATWLDKEGIDCSGTCQSPDKFKGHTLDSVYKDPLPQCRDNNSMIHVHARSMAILTCPIAYATWVVPDNITLQDYGQSLNDHYYLTNGDSLVVWNTHLQQGGTYQCVSGDGDQVMVYHLDVLMSKGHITMITASVVLLLVVSVALFCFIRRRCRRSGYQPMGNRRQPRGDEAPVQYKRHGQDPIDVGHPSVNQDEEISGHVQTYINPIVGDKPEDRNSKDKNSVSKIIESKNLRESVASKPITK